MINFNPFYEHQLSFLQQRFNKGLKVRLIIFFFASTHNVHNNAIHKTINNSNVFASLLKIEVPYFYVHTYSVYSTFFVENSLQCYQKYQNPLYWLFLVALNINNAIHNTINNSNVLICIITKNRSASPIFMYILLHNAVCSAFS